MTRRLFSKARLLPATSAAIAAATAALALAGPASAAPAEAVPVAHPGAVTPAVNWIPDRVNAAAIDALWWVDCHRDDTHTSYVFLQGNGAGCNAEVWGFASLTNRGTSHILEVCLIPGGPSSFSAVVNPANPDGTASGETIQYTTYSTSSCLVRTLGYPIRKFRATADLQNFSYWQLPSP
jgi:hypothetical protein